ncbi:hypothetical protein FACS189413_12620 [Bacteroidia bacterium]|nr:hypothetical protein FACS189413_12620 [Bacteroidia bacterium]
MKKIYVNYLKNGSNEVAFPQKNTRENQTLLSAVSKEPSLSYCFGWLPDASFIIERYKDRLYPHNLQRIFEVISSIQADYCR